MEGNLIEKAKKSVDQEAWAKLQDAFMPHSPKRTHFKHSSIPVTDAKG